MPRPTAPSSPAPVPAPTPAAADPTGPEGTVLVRFFAGAAAAAGREEQALPLTGPVPLAALLDRLIGQHGPDLGRVLGASTFLLDTVAARRDDVVGPGSTLDVLPPFAGG
ncbi:MoaD/ThiS family protein [Kineococcus gynurae]|uniref:MoaD/ThiS family protein n=1 Tax=Kineococcus gynurae TaxID=452979 RepID=A0ABV5LWL7_9ACTN